MMDWLVHVSFYGADEEIPSDVAAEIAKEDAYEKRGLAKEAERRKRLGQGKPLAPKVGE